eukprot:6209622-Pleurochrysis_carterae.AAC.2
MSSGSAGPSRPACRVPGRQARDNVPTRGTVGAGRNKRSRSSRHHACTACERRRALATGAL